MKKGSKMSKKSREKMRKAKHNFFERGGHSWNYGKHTGQKPTASFKKGHPAWNKNRPMTDQEKKHLSKVRIGQHAGNRHPRWSGGKFAFQKKKAKERDNNTCQKCGYYNDEFRNSAVDIDHILSKKKYPELKNDINNLITLCPNCHRIKTLKEKDFKNNI